jgi:formylglycine-generating enzyme required for sulfatase activity
MRNFKLILSITIVFLIWHVFFLNITTVQAQNVETYSNSIDMEFVRIEPGSFKMGGDGDAKQLFIRSLFSISNSTPHEVIISEAFFLSKYEVTQKEWEKVMGENPSYYPSPNNPVEMVSWGDVQEFIRRLNRMEGHNRYRLPTEAEWEYAARAGTEMSLEEFENTLERYAWYGVTETHQVGSKQANAWGLYDMQGNVSEWVQDWYNSLYYFVSTEIDPIGLPVGITRVIRGGNFKNSPWNCHVIDRLALTPELKSHQVGFRLAYSPK